MEPRWQAMDSDHWSHALNDAMALLNSLGRMHFATAIDPRLARVRPSVCASEVSGGGPNNC